MQSVAVDDANPQAGEEAYILQLSLPSPSGGEGDVLMDKMGRFVELYLSAAQPEIARFAQMGGTTWVIAAPADAAYALDEVRADLAVTLYGSDDAQKVQLEWPHGVEPIAPEPVEEQAEAAFDGMEDVEAGSDFERSDYAPPEQEIPVFTTDVIEDSADAGDAEFDVGDDAWTLGDEEGGDTDATLQEVSPLNHIDIDIEDLDAVATGESLSETSTLDAGPSEDDWALEAKTNTPSDTSDDDDVFVIDDLNDGPAQDLAESVSSDDAAAFEPSATSRTEDDDAGYALEVASAAQRAAFDDTTDVFEVDAFDIEIVDDHTAPETFEMALETGFDGTVDLVDDAPETLTEVPERPAQSDMTEELSNFRSEMRDIAASIPGTDGDEVLAAFRAELDAISGAMGQRVDGAAQRIESAAADVVDAAARVDADRLSAAADRAERSAQQLENSVADALSALNAAMNAMADRKSDSASDVVG